MNRLTKLFAATAISAGLIFVPATVANADPITCPPGQDYAKNPSDGGWVCVNKGGNENNSEDPKGDKPKGYFRH